MASVNLIDSFSTRVFLFFCLFFLLLNLMYTLTFTFNVQLQIGLFTFGSRIFYHLFHFCTQSQRSLLDHFLTILVSQCLHFDLLSDAAIVYRKRAALSFISISERVLFPQHLKSYKSFYRNFQALT